MAAKSVLLSVEVRPAKQLLECQTIFLHPDVFTLLNASIGDFLRLQLPNGSCLIAKAKPDGKSRSKQCPTKSTKNLVYLATCISCVAANWSSGEQVPSTHFILDLSKVKVLEKVPIESFTCKVWFRNTSACLMYKKNKLLYIKTLQKILSMYGVISNSCVDLSVNSNAKIFGISRVQLGNVKTCCLPNNSLTDQKLDDDCNFVGYRFVCSNLDCHLNSESLKASRVTKHCEMCSKNSAQSLNRSPVACVEGGLSFTSSPCEPCGETTTALPSLSSTAAEECSTKDPSWATAVEECSTKDRLSDQSSPQLSTCSNHSSNENVLQAKQPQTHDIICKTQDPPDRTNATLECTHGSLEYRHGLPDCTDNTFECTRDTANITLDSPDRTHDTSNQTHVNVDNTHCVLNRTSDTIDRTHSPTAGAPHPPTCGPPEHVRYGSVTVCMAESLQQLQLRQEQQVVPVGGLDKAKEELQRLLKEMSMREAPGSTTRMVSGCGALLIGPPGCGKSTLVRHLSAAAATILVTVCCRTMASSSSKNTATERFKEAKLLSQDRPCILFLSHIDQLATLPPHNLRKDRWSLTDVRNSMSSCLDSNCLIVATTTDAVRVHQCLRTMFQTELVLGSSSLAYRDDVLRVLALIKRWPGLDHHTLAKLTPGYVGADLKQLMEHVEELLRKKNKFLGNMSSEDLTKLTMDEASHFTPHLIKSNPLLEERPQQMRLGGMDHLMAEMQQILNQMIDSGNLFARLALNVPRGVLLYGPPGCGKTQLMCSLAASRGCTFFVVQPKHIVSPFVGETEQNLQAAFQAARTCRPSVLFFDEIDGLFGDRSGGQVSEVRQNLILEMLQILDGASAEEGRHSSSMDGVLVCGATNNPHKLDAALLRPGRFDRVVYVPPPTADQRLQILKVKCAGTELESEDVLEEIAAQTDLFTGADLDSIIRKATEEALLSGHITADGRVQLTTTLLRKYAARTKPTVTQDTIRRYQAFKKR